MTTPRCRGQGLGRVVQPLTQSPSARATQLGSEAWGCALPLQSPQEGSNLDVGVSVVVVMGTPGWTVTYVVLLPLMAPCVCFHDFTLKGQFPFSPAHLRGQ